MDKSGEGLSIERQEAECRKLATRLGLEVAATFRDHDTSATSGKPRKNWGSTDPWLADRG